MKKQLLFLVVLLTAVHTVLAQDTIVGRSPDYYYMDWYDECERFYLPYGAHIDRVCLIEMGSYDQVSYVQVPTHEPASFGKRLVRHGVD